MEVEASREVLLGSASFCPSQCKQLHFLACPEFVNGCRYAVSYRVSTRSRAPITLSLSRFARHLIPRDIQLLYPSSPYIGVDAAFEIQLGAIKRKDVTIIHQETKTVHYSYTSHSCKLQIHLVTVTQSTQLQLSLKNCYSK